MASMTYLQLAQLAHRILKMGNATPGSLPAAIPIVGTGIDQVAYDIVDMVPRAWEEIQNESPSWTFMRKSNTLLLTAGTRFYSLSVIQAKISDYYGFVPFYAPNSGNPYFTIYDSGLPTASWVDYPYPFIEYINWRGFWDRLPRPANGQPNRMTEQPNLGLEFDPTPANAPSGGQWTVRLDYRRTNQVLAATGDIPILPAEFHEMIAYKTVMLVAEMRQNQGPGIAYASSQYDKGMGHLKSRYLPQLQIDLSY